MTFVLASVFNGLTPILIPYDTEVARVADILKDSVADCLVAAAGSVSLEGLLSQFPDLRQVIWVAEPTSRHMDWDEVPEGVGGKAEVAVWHDIVEDKGNSTSLEMSLSTPDQKPPNVVIISRNTESQNYHSVEYLQEV